jgi:cell wall-associated NlpC family hydrolase
VPLAAVPSTGAPPRPDASSVLPASASSDQATTAASFEAILAASRVDPVRAPTVTLGEMVAALSGKPVPPAMPVLPDTADGTQRPEAAGVQAARATGDDWGTAGARPAAATSRSGAAVLDAGERYLGVPYRWGGTSASSGFDCSGFVQQVFADLGVRLPRVSVDQAKQGRAVASMAEAQPGDLVFWRGSGSRPNHIGIYAGDGTMLVAPRTGDVVRYQNITRTPDLIRRVVD